MDKYEGNYKVKVKANLTENETVTVVPAATVELVNEGGDSVLGIVTQTINSWKLNVSASNEIESDDQNFIETTGKISADLKKAGNYSGNLNFIFTKVSN